MESLKGQGGVQMLITAEQEAQQIVASARNWSNVRRLDEETARKVQSLKDVSSKISYGVVAMLMKQVTTVKN
ncbi:hypothetical protein IFM89_020210 [Coptis chinensis]|uniref:Uncharacterized protein n=1 Tax=Coptis chinensis TaxID=261450 RepID=A0A835HNS6_9MAGN|nr:hypothetical protein IFM89_020210 [Coptis chinensis]